MNSLRVVAIGLSLTWAAVAPAQTCTYTLVPASKTFRAAGGTGSFVVNTASDCVWTAVASEVWITLTGGTPGAGTGTVNYLVAPNTSPNLRTGRIYVSNRTNTITQSPSRAAICPVKLTGVLAYTDEADDEVVLRIRLRKGELVEDEKHRLALAVDPDSSTVRLIELDADDTEINELAISERAVFLPGNLFASDLIFDSLPVYSEAAGLDFVADGSLQFRGAYSVNSNGLPNRVTGKLIGVLNDPVNGGGDGPAAIFKGVISPAGQSITP
jgi:hypothetical protein